MHHREPSLPLSGRRYLGCMLLVPVRLDDVRETRWILRLIYTDRQSLHCDVQAAADPAVVSISVSPSMTSQPWEAA